MEQRPRGGKGDKGDKGEEPEATPEETSAEGTPEERAPEAERDADLAETVDIRNAAVEDGGEAEAEGPESEAPSRWFTASASSSSSDNGDEAEAVGAGEDQPVSDEPPHAPVHHARSDAAEEPEDSDSPAEPPHHAGPAASQEAAEASGSEPDAPAEPPHHAGPAASQEAAEASGSEPDAPAEPPHRARAARPGASAEVDTEPDAGFDAEPDGKADAKPTPAASAPQPPQRPRPPRPAPPQGAPSGRPPRPGAPGAPGVPTGAAGRPTRPGPGMPPGATPRGPRPPMPAGGAPRGPRPFVTPPRGPHGAPRTGGTGNPVGPDGPGISPVPPGRRAHHPSVERQRLQAAFWPPRVSRNQLVVGLLLAILGAALAIQVRATNTGDLLRAARPDDLVHILDDTTARGQRLDTELRQLESQKASLQNSTDKAQAALEQAQQKAKDLQILAGTTKATGPGITVTITDPLHKVDAAALLNALQELRAAGAEVVQLDNVRIVVSSAFLDTNAGQVTVDGHVLAAPYVFKVIGDPATLQPALGIPGGVVANLKSNYGAATAIATDQHILVDAIAAQPNPQYASAG